MNLENVVSAENNIHVSAGHRLETLKGCCGIPARLSGFVSWCAQLLLLLVSVVLTALIFLHIGGYAYFLSSTGHNATLTSEIIDTHLSESFVTIEPSEPLLLANETLEETAKVIKILEGNDTEYQTTQQAIFHGPFEQIRDVHLRIGSFAINLLPVLRIINIIYTIFCVLWLASLACLLLSLKLELLDLVLINCFFLVIAIVACLFQALLVGILIFYEESLNWNRMSVIAGSAGGFTLCFIFGILALYLLMIWYKYIDYSYNRKDACVCLASITECIKRRKQGGAANRDQAAAAAGYTIPEATTHSGLPYIDEGPVTHFSNF